MGLRYLGNINKPGYNPLASNITTGVNVVQYQGIFTTQQQLQAITTGQWVTDPVFDYSTLLLQADGIANGSQNNTFLDSSTNNFTITRNGNTTQGTFSPFSLQPGAWANYFNGSSQLTVPNTNGPIQFGTGAFTIEFWIYPSDVSNRQAILATTSGSGTGPVVALSGSPAGAFGVGIYGSADTLNTGAGVIVTNKWQHIAVVRNSTASNDSFIYVDGILRATGTISTNFSTAYAVSIGQNGAGGEYFTGYLSNLRVVKGTAVYTTNFTPSPTPLTAITNTSLLTCQNNRFVDNSSNAFAVTVNGTPSVQAFSSFAPQFQYTASGTGGSGYFDGTGDYLNLSNPSQLAFGSGDWYIETWVYVNTIGGDQFLYDGRPASTNGLYITLFIQNVSNKLDFYTNTGDRILSNSALTQGQWYHVVLSKASGTTRMFINGVAQTQTYADSNTYINGASRPNIGAGGPTVSSYLNGYLSGFRVVVGTGLTSVTVPTAPPTAVTNTQLLLNFTNAGILDGTMKNNLETVGNASVSTSVVKYGSGSMYFDGTGDELYFPSGVNFDLGTTYTIECWVYPNSVASNFGIILRGSYDTGTSNWTGLQFSLRWLIGTGLRAYFYGTTAANEQTITSSSSALVANQWQHIAMVRNGTNGALYINGVSVGTISSLNTPAASTQPVRIGNWKFSSGDNYLNGYLDDFRITTGIARYTQNFNPPSVALPRQ